MGSPTRIRRHQRRQPPGYLALLIALTLVLAGASLPTHAAPGTVVHTLKGKMANDPNSRVKVRVVVRNRDPKRLKGLEFSNLDAFCDEDPAGQLTGKAGKNLGPGVEFDNSVRWVSFPRNPSRQVNLVGKLRRHGKKLTGRLEVFSNTTCANAGGKVTLRK